LTNVIPEFIYPDWPAPENVRALTTTRIGGYSAAPFDSFNLSLRSGDNIEHVKRNRALLIESADLPTEPVWLRQVHGNRVIDAADSEPYSEADGSYTQQPRVVCVVLTADCCPVFLCDRNGKQVAVLHCGWRGIARGLIEQGVERMKAPAMELLAWLGPAIGPDSFEVGDDVYETFAAHDSNAAAGFRRRENGRWLADIYALVSQRLYASGVTQISGANHCTVLEHQRFFSYRRDRVCGHMASLIWMV
jgi:YfiH family protein